jgi:hypothetical protein
MDDKTRDKIVIGVLLLSMLPIWRSGGRSNLTFWGFIINHTIYGPPVEYVPEEDYTKELITGV